VIEFFLKYIFWLSKSGMGPYIQLMVLPSDADATGPLTVFLKKNYELFWGSLPLFCGDWGVLWSDFKSEKILFM
jgi:hypothetical protein